MRRFDDALVALGRLDALTAHLPNATPVLYSFVGCYVYCTDAETAAFLRSRIREPREDESLREVAEEPAPYERS